MIGSKSQGSLSDSKKQDESCTCPLFSAWREGLDCGAGGRVPGRVQWFSGAKLKEMGILEPR